jgi:thymidylate synthase
MRIFKGNSFAQVYHDLLKNLVEEPQYVCSPRDQKIKEILNVGLEIENPMSGLYKNSIRGSQNKYIAAELVFYFSGRNDLDYIQRYAKFWKDIANPDGTVNSAYGHLLFKRYYNGITQWEWAYESLKKDKDTRQALMHFNLPEHQHFANKDFVCTLNGIFHIREDKLDLTIMMRSNDVILGLPTDVAFFCMLQQQMFKLLQKVYPDLEMGKYTHYVNSMHLYERNFSVVDDMLLVEFREDFIPEIKENLVDEKGEMTSMMKEVHDAIEHGHSLIVDDPTFAWIQDKINIVKTTI